MRRNDAPEQILKTFTPAQHLTVGKCWPRVGRGLRTTTP